MKLGIRTLVTFGLIMYSGMSAIVNGPGEIAHLRTFGSETSETKYNFNWTRRDSNSRPQPRQGCVIATKLQVLNDLELICIL